jgi:hypothetical protein
LAKYPPYPQKNLYHKKGIIPINFISSLFSRLPIAFGCGAEPPPVPGLVLEFYPIDLTHVSTSSQLKEFLFR